jgi:GT2 family glycosyltransferase
LSLVKACINSILNKTLYNNFEIILVDNNSDDPLCLEYFRVLNAHPKIRVLSYPKPFNYSAINNFAVKHARGEVVGLINNDIEVISSSWLDYMVSLVQFADVGCVGAKLLYGDGRIQHAGVVMGYGGGAGHAHKYFPRWHHGYLNRLAATNEFSAVTAACLLVKKKDYLAVDGLNECDLTIAFNDVDFCLKVLQLGKRNIYCAEAELYHHESISRGADNTKEKQLRFANELKYLQDSWKNYIENDPAYNSSLTLSRENFALKE